jgi:serine protease Do
MVLDLSLQASQVSDALAELAQHVARSVVVVRGSFGSSGSGVVWNRPRLVITNAHVVPGPAAELVLADGRRLVARVVRRAPALDLAALEVEADLAWDPIAARVGDSNRLRPGDLVVAVGNPMGERNAPSLGIVAGPRRDVLQLAITLRPGNSGGALANARGEVVGIPHMVTGSGLALAVSTHTVEQFLGSQPGGEPEPDLHWV